MRPSISLPIRKIASCLGMRLLRRLVSGGMRWCLDCGRGPFAKSALGKQRAGAIVARKKEASGPSQRALWVNECPFAKNALGKRVARNRRVTPHPGAMRMIVKRKGLQEKQFVPLADRGKRV